MNRITASLGLLALLAVSASAQTLKEYLHLRRSHGIVEAVGVPALETLVGTRIFEVQGVVKGSIRVGDTSSLLLEKTDGSTMMVEATSVPDWLVGNETQARLIIKATRTEVNSTLQTSLIGAAKEEDISPIEAASLEANLKKMKVAKGGKVADWHKYLPNGGIAEGEWQLPDYIEAPTLVPYIMGDNRRLSENEAVRIAKGVIHFSRMYGVDWRLIMAMVVCESDFNPNERSHAGALGLGQLMPETISDYGITNPFDSVQNLYGTVREIRSHIDKYRTEIGDNFQALVLGLAAYNAGEGAVRRHNGVPPFRETQNYVRRVIGLYSQWCKRKA